MPGRNNGKSRLLACGRSPQNQDMTTGNLGLTDEEENQIVAFLKRLRTATQHLIRFATLTQVLA